MRNKELLEMAKRANSAEEFFALTKESNVEFTQEQAEAYFEQINNPCELSDDELDNVAGGTVYDHEGRPAVKYNDFCERWVCPYCGGSVIDIQRPGRYGRHTCEYNSRSKVVAICSFCKYSIYDDGQDFCDHPDMKK